MNLKNARTPYITVSCGMSGWFAVLMAPSDSREFYEPWTTGFGRYSEREHAEMEAKEWASVEELRVEL